ncbi:ANTAR domain-containing protein [Williamsia sp. SKLECPSW1]
MSDRDDPRSLAALLADLGDSISCEDELAALMQRVVDVVREVVDGVEMARITVDLDGRTHCATRGDENGHPDHPRCVIPLDAAGRHLGELTLYGPTVDRTDGDVPALVATVVGRTIGDYTRFRSAADAADAMRAALETRAPIEQAKGIIMADHGVNADQAFAVLRARSQNSNRRVREIAADLIVSRTRDIP